MYSPPLAKGGSFAFGQHVNGTRASSICRFTPGGGDDGGSTAGSPMSEVTSVLGGYGLSPQQARAWSLEAPEPRSPYLVRCCARIDGPLDIAELESSLRRLVASHE